MSWQGQARKEKEYIAEVSPDYEAEEGARARVNPNSLEQMRVMSWQ